MVQNINNKKETSNLAGEIIISLLSGKAHLREISRRIKKPHSTVLRKINGLVKDNIVDYTKEGKNKVFFIKKNISARSYILIAERYKMLKLLKNYPKLSVILEDALKKADKGMIILFGSYASFTAKEDSDIDLYIETIDKKIKYTVQDINSKISVKIGNFDLSSLLIKEIIKNHVIVRGEEEFYEKIRFFEQAV